MKLLYAAVVCFLLWAETGFCAKLPTAFKKCDRKLSVFNGCLKNALQDAVVQLRQPIKELGLPSLEPLYVPTLTIGQGNGPVALQQDYKELYIHSYSKPRIEKFDLDFEKKTATIQAFYESLGFTATYNINGKILLLPVFGNGPVKIDFYNVTLTNDFVFEEYEKKGKQYWKVISSKLTAHPDFMRHKWDNLFNGDKALGDSINQVVNDNWKEIYEDIHEGYENALARINQNLFDAVLSRIPLSELFES